MWIERFVRTRDTLSPHLAHRPLQLSVRLLHARRDMRFSEVMPLGSIAGFQMDSVVPVSEMKLRIESELGHLEPVGRDGHNPDNTLGAFGRKQLAAGRSHTCLLKTNSRVVCWGVDSSGALLLTGNGVGAFAQVVTGLDSCATKRGGALADAASSPSASIPDSHKMRRALSGWGLVQMVHCTSPHPDSHSTPRIRLYQTSGLTATILWARIVSLSSHCMPAPPTITGTRNAKSMSIGSM